MRMTAAQVMDHQRKHGFIEAEKVLTLPLLVETLDRIDFFMEFEPPEITSQQKGVRIVVPNNPAVKAFPSFFTKPEVVKAEKAIAAHLSPFKPKHAFTGPLRLVTEWTWEWNKSEPKKNRVDGWKWRETKPDFDNISKLLCDQMTVLGFWHDDSQIVDARVTKRFGDRPGIRITLEALTPQAPQPAPKPAVKDPEPF